MTVIGPGWPVLGDLSATVQLSGRSGGSMPKVEVAGDQGCQLARKEIRSLDGNG